jgi:hypothetical protein
MGAEQLLQNFNYLVENDFDRFGHYETIVGWFTNVLLYGQGYLKVGWRQRKQRRKEVFLGDTGEVEEREVVDLVEDRCDIQLVDNMSLYFSPEATFPHVFDTAHHVIHKSRKRRSHLMMLKEMGIYGPEGGGQGFDYNDLSSAPDDDRHVGAGTTVVNKDGGDDQDPDDPLVTVKEYWEDDTVIVVLNDGVLARNEPNPFGLQGHAKKKPFVAAFDTLVPGELFQIGEGEPLEHTQTEMSTLRRQRTDNNTLIINSGIVYNKDADVDLESWGLSRPGMAIGARPIDGSLANSIMPIPRGDINGASYREFQDLDKDGQEISGLLDYAVGSSPERRETATTVQLLQTAANLRFDIKIRNAASSLSELGYMWFERNKQFLTKAVPIKVPMPNGLNFEYREITKNELPEYGQVDIVVPGSPGLLLKDSRRQMMLQLYEAMRQNEMVDPMAALQMLTLIIKESEIDGIEAIIQLLQQPNQMALMQQQAELQGAQADSGGGLPVPKPPGSPDAPGVPQETQVNENPMMAFQGRQR